ncbi:MAG TPA: efflux RND transporter periplasmic adaptor subunit [Vicinamibacterales bacterium]|nr:efflux RND transporter periplasmic adaptor subunit [Vicinamibacterales bacterium]
MSRSLVSVITIALALAISAAGCRREAPIGPPRASGYVEATDVRVSAKVPGRVEKVNVVEGARVNAGDTLVVLSTTDVTLVLSRVRAERDQAVANLRLLQAGARPEDIRQLEAQLAAATAERQAAEAEVSAARADEARFEQLLRNKAGSPKQRDDAVARRELAEARLKAAADRVAAAAAALARAKAGARAEEIAGARARVAAVDAQIASLEHDRGEATVSAPMAGIVGSRLVEPGEIVGQGAGLLVLIDLDRAWANVYVEEPLVPSLRLDQPATVLTDAGHRLAGRITFISPRAEFTPRNVQTAEERAKLVYRVKVTVDNREGILKPGMPVEAEFGAAR